MQQQFAILLTVVITITTVVYTFYSIRLWKTSKISANISRQAALATLWAELNNYIAMCKEENRPEAPFLQKLSGIFAEYMIANLINNVTKNDPYVVEFKRKIADAVDKENFDISLLDWLKPFINQ